MAWKQSNRSLRAALPVALAALLVVGTPLLAQVNTGKVGDAVKDSVTESAAGGTNTSGAGTEVDPNAPAEGEAAKPADPAKPNPEKIDPLDDFKKRQPTEAEREALKLRALAFLKEALEIKPDIRNATFTGRAPWVSRAPRQNPFDPQISKPLPFNKLNLDSVPPPPYYPPQGGIEKASQAEEFQQFLDTARLAGIVTLGPAKERQALVVFGRTTVRLKEGQEVEQKNYTLNVVDITEDTVRVSAAGGELQGLLTMDNGSGKLYSGEGERGLVIISESSESRTGQG